MLTAIHRRLIDFIESSGVPFRLLSHPPCRTSVESALARAKAGSADSIGAKALVLRSSRSRKYVMVVVPGGRRMSNGNLRKILGSYRFADVAELEHATGGLSPGMIPPFIAPVFPAIETLLVDEEIARAAKIGFNAAHLERSVVVSGGDYLTMIQSMFPRVEPLSLPPGPDIAQT